MAKGEERLIGDYLEKVAILTRINMDDNDLTEDEAVTKTVEIANEQIRKIMSMNKKQFLMFTLMTLAQMHGAIEERSD